RAGIRPAAAPSVGTSGTGRGPEGTCLARGDTKMRRTSVALLAALAWASPALAADPLASWNDGAAKKAIVDFVAAATRAGGPKFVPPAERIAVFDNDGTLWSEQPMYFQLAFALDRVRALAPANPTWRTTEPFASILAMDIPTALADPHA